MGRTSDQRRASKITKAALVVFLSWMATVTHWGIGASTARADEGSASKPKVEEGGEKLVDRIVAVVNSELILHSEVDEKVKTGHLVTVSEYPLDEKAPPYDRALEDEINFELIMQKAEDLEIEVDDAQVEAEIQSFLKTRNLNAEGLESALREQGMTYDTYKKDFKDQMILRKFQGHVIHPMVKVTDKDLETYFLKKTGTTADHIRVVLRHIITKIPEGASQTVIDGKLARANEAHEKLKHGMVFAEAARIYSDDEKARDSGGLMQPIKLIDLAESMRSQIEPLDVGGFTEPVKGPDGIHIFQLESRSFAGSDEFVRQKKQLEFELRTLELANQTRRWLAEQRRRSKLGFIK